MRLLPLAALVSVGCAQPATSVLVHVENGEAKSPHAVTVNVFDDYGLLGRSHIPDPVLPGALTISGLPSVAQSLRVVALSDEPHMVAGARFQTKPHEQVTERLVLRLVTGDSDGDGVPDNIDDCPTVPDPDQHNGDGSGGGEACEGGSGSDMAMGDVTDLADVDLTGIDLSHSQPSDLASAADLAHAPPDLARPDLAIGPVVPALFSEGFENGIGGATWTTIQTNGSVAISPNQVHRGFYALRVQTNAVTAAGAVQAAIFETTVVPLPDLWVRVFAFVPGGTDPASVAVLVVDQTATAHRGLKFGFAQGSFTTTNGVPTPAVTLNATTPLMPSDQWVCLEWHVRVATNGFSQAFLEGNEIGALSAVANTQPSPSVAEIGLGLVASGKSAAREIFFDDFAVGAGPVGCDQ